MPEIDEYTRRYNLVKQRHNKALKTTLVLYI